ncbi:sensor histidine kinase [Streptomyces roseirectus]|uniref:histidine kinase n=1 Tax=Streptomyces roseirectus TaxID=2768066 RepID=A0A7H0ISR6_9ACTN|nr:histidine kinase [Streptomyces roseirectus]QNP75832.1 sensor histidine kinase [Streptomyces roseirectus]
MRVTGLEKQVERVLRGTPGEGRARRALWTTGAGAWPVRALRGLGQDLWPTRPAPLPPSVWLRWLPHGLVCLAAIVATLANVDQFDTRYRLGVEFGLVCALAQGVALVVALWWPLHGWWLSLVTTGVAALGARSRLLMPESPAGFPDLAALSAGVYWPWGVPGLVVHALVLFLLALRVPARVSAQALALTALATWIVEGVIGGSRYVPSGPVAVAVFLGAVLLGAAMRGRREARSQLLEQTGITAEERARRTLLEERSRIARELHDVVAHHMSVISIQAQVAPHLVADPPEELKENLAGIRQNALEALAELRRVLGVLRSESPEDTDGPYGLGVATGTAPDAPQPTLDRLDGLLDNTRAAGLDVVKVVTGEPPTPPYPPGVQLSAYRIVQEALSNVLRHAPGAGVTVEIGHQREGVLVSVTNSRPSRPADPSPGAGHGLLGMRERAAMLGGHLVAHPNLHGGYVVSAFLPRDGVRVDVPEADETVLDGLTITTGPSESSLFRLELPGAPARNGQGDDDPRPPGPPHDATGDEKT